MITSLFILLIVVISIISSRNNKVYQLLIFHPCRKYQLHRYITYAFVHSSFLHLLFNAGNFLIFGLIAESMMNRTMYIQFIFLSIIISALPYTKKEFILVGFSGCVSAITFFCILHYPVIFAISILYLFYCWYMDKHATDTIAHGSHLWAAIFAFFFTLIFFPDLIFNIFVP